MIVVFPPRATANTVGRAMGVCQGKSGYYGFNWSSAVSETNGVFLHFYTQGLTPGYSSYRAHGFQLRCLSE